MTIAERFRNEWWDMITIDRKREVLLNKEHREVRHEMIRQECQAGIKTLQEIADEYKMHKTTVYRINKGGGLNK